MLLLLLLAFACGAGLARAVAGHTGHERRALAARLAAVGRRGDGESSARRSLAEEQLDGGWQERFWLPVRARLAAWGLRLTPAGASDRLRGLLARAGLPKLGVGEFAALRVAGAAAGVSLALAACAGLPPNLRVLAVVIGLALGLALPESLVQSAVRRREALIRRALPEVIDLLVVSVEAGLSLDAALGKVSEKMTGPLPAELTRAREETMLGKTRTAALRDMAARLEMREVKTFTAALAQADRFGIPIGRVLRAQSGLARAAKLQTVREQAARLPVTLLFPLIFFIFPAVFVVLLGPSLIRLMTVLGGK